MSERDLDRARADFERLATQTAKRVLEFYEARRDARSFAGPPIVPTASVSSGSLVEANPSQGH
jgi:hypothetical protein